MRPCHDYAVIRRSNVTKMSKKRTPFDILGVTPADEMTTIRLAWRAKVRLLHPDRMTDKAAATAELAEVNAAFDALQGHIPKRSAKKSWSRKLTEKRFAKPKAAMASADPEPRDQSPGRRAPQQRQERRAESSRVTPGRPMSKKAQALSERARAGYARARDIVASA